MIDADRAQNVGRARALGVVALAFFLEVQSVEGQLPHAFGLARLGQAFDPLKLRLRQLVGKSVRIDAEHFREQLGRGLRVRDFAGEHPDRVHRGAARQLDAEAVEDLTPLGADLDNRLLLLLCLLDEPLGAPNLQVPKAKQDQADPESTGEAEENEPDAGVTLRATQQRGKPGHRRSGAPSGNGTEPLAGASHQRTKPA